MLRPGRSTHPTHPLPPQSGKQKQQPKMKKNIVRIAPTAIALLALPAVATAQSPVIEGTSYYLPKTAMQFRILIEKTSFKPGDFCEYADRYLKLGDASLDAATSYRIVDMQMKLTGEADTSKYYTAHISPKLSISKVYIGDNGVLRSVNTEPDPLFDDKPFVPAPKKKSLNPRDFMSETILSAGSRAKMAQLCAEEIYEIRNSRNELTRGTAETMPTDGEQLRLMLASLDTQEAALRSLFEGTVRIDTTEYVITVSPEREVDRRLLFRFSDAFGMVDADDLSGEPYYISVSDLHQTPEDTRTEKEKQRQKDETGLNVNVPGRAHVAVFRNETVCMEQDISYAQFGRVDNISPLLFSKKVFTSYKVSPVTGSVMGLHSEEREK